jgi:hypothetical protein
MKRYLILLFVVFGLFTSCVKIVQPKCRAYKKVLSVKPYHSTRVFVTYISQCGDTIITSEHCSGTIKADNITFHVRDYLDGKLKYGVVK